MVSSSPFRFRKCCLVEKTVTGDLNSSWAFFRQSEEKAEYAVPTNSCLIGELSLLWIWESFLCKMYKFVSGSILQP